ncbi:ABC-type antimicrobial peptide transport system, ATPase component [Thiovulum sp. ES]|nr:ABC-type antimicrobial peptide transport system, ATPase component [Thiovulum sp. ES]
MNFQDKTILLESKNLSHSFDNQNPLFNDINISVRESETVSIIGVSGSGKSTLLHILSGTIKPENGSVFHFNKEFWKQKQKERELVRRNDIGLIFQFHYLFKGFSVRENLEVASLLSGEKLDFSILENFGIAHLLEKKVTQLSGGEQQRVSIARVLTKKPKIIFADELTGNLDKQTANIVMKTLFDYVKTAKASLVLVTHDEDLASQCDHIFKLKDGNFYKK